MISVIEVYNAVRDLANKHQKGFVSASVFNSFAQVAQQSVYESMFQSLVTAKGLRNNQRDPGQGESVYRGVEDDLSDYIKDAQLESSTTANIAGDSNLFSKPQDFYKLISMRSVGDERTPIELVYRPDQMSHILSSNLSAPTEQFPVALVSRNIEVFPTDVGGVIMTYYRQPSSKYGVSYFGNNRGDLDEDSHPRIVVTSPHPINGEVSFVIQDCRDFDLPDRFKAILVAEICKMIGIRLRDGVLAQFGQTASS